LKILKTFFVKTKTSALGLKTKTKTLLFVLEAPRDQDFGPITGTMPSKHRLTGDRRRQPAYEIFVIKHRF